jgi:hypothetical protein
MLADVVASRAPSTAPKGDTGLPAHHGEPDVKPPRPKIAKLPELLKK